MQNCSHSYGPKPLSPSPPPLALAIVGPNQPYHTTEIVQQFTLPVWFEVPWEPALAEVLSDGPDEPKHFHDSRLMRHLRSQAKELTLRLRARELVDPVAGEP